MKFFLLLFPALFISIYVFFIWGFFGYCSMISCMGSGKLIPDKVVIGTTFIVASALPLVLCLALFYLRSQERSIGPNARILFWTLIGMIFIFGTFQVTVDPGDAFWAGIPIISLSALLAAALITL